MATTGNVGAPRRAPDSSMAGPLVIGTTFLHILFGFLTVQVYLYHLAFPRDRVWMKSMVYGVYLVLLAQDIFVIHNTYLRETSRLIGAGLGWFFVPVLGGIVGFVVQAFYAWRIYKLSERRVVAVLLALLAFVSNIAAFISAGFGSQARNVAELNSNRGVRICSTVWYTGSAVCDILIAGYMIHLLTRNNDALGNTRMVVRRIIRLTIETNSLTASVAVVTVILLLVYPGKTHFTASSLVLPSIYANTLLVMLNLRIRVSQTDDFDFSWFSSLDDGTKEELARFVASQQQLQARIYEQATYSHHYSSQPYIPQGQGVAQGPSASVSNYYAPTDFHALPAQQVPYDPQHQLVHAGYHSSSSSSGSSSSLSGTHNGRIHTFTPSTYGSSMQTGPQPLDLAIWGSPNKRLSRAEICEAIATRFEYYRDESTGAWRNTIRHTLSLKSAFKLCDRVPGQSGRGNYWEIDFANFEGNKRERKRGRNTRGTEDEEEARREISPSSSLPLDSSSASGSVNRRERTRYAHSSASQHGAAARRPSPSHSSPGQLFPASDPGSAQAHYASHPGRLSAYHYQTSMFGQSGFIPQSQSIPILPSPHDHHAMVHAQYPSTDTLRLSPPSYSSHPGGPMQEQQGPFGGGY
uniref:Fork-head domain-containing protein n=1 Tax=Moniliophthora roreri TaxID=221103 RepID=A0A0W0GAU9_MONRR